MPTKDGRLTKDERQRLVDWLNQKWTHRTCTSCGTHEWDLMDQLTMMPVYMQRTEPEIGRAVVCVSAICQNCARMEFFNALVMNVVGVTRQDNFVSAEGESDAE